MEIGKLRDVIKFEKDTPTEVDGAGLTENFAEFLTTRGYMRKTRGDRVLEANQLSMASTFKLTIRFETAINTELNGGETLRIVCNNRFFTIDSFDNVENRNQWIEFILSEKQYA